MKKRYIFKKWDMSKDTTKCSLCPNQTLYFITDRKTGEEWFCCLECAYKKYKIKRLKSLLKKKYPVRKKKTILAQNSLVKNSKNAPQTPTCSKTPTNSNITQHSGNMEEKWNGGRK